jgi:signal transduction histidine kinase
LTARPAQDRGLLTARPAQDRRLLTAWPAWLAAAGLAAGAGVAWLISQASPSQGTIPDVPLALPVAVLVGWSLIGSGLLAARSRREDHLALALIFTGFAWFASMLPLSHNPVLFTAGEVVYALYYAGFLVLRLPAALALGRAAWFVAAAIPVAVLLVFIQRRLAQSAVAGLVVELGAPGVPGAAVDLRAALSRALGDPSLALAYWYPAESRYVDSGGRPVELPEAGAARGSTVIERDGQPVAALIHDPALEYNPGLVDSVCAAAGLTLDNERLAAELRARLVDLQASRARLVETADTERRRIERNLHDGAQQQLVALKISLGLARQLVTSAPGEAAGLIAQTEQQAADALEELRELARGIYPPLLADLGLRAALEAQARKAVIAVAVDAPGLGRYPQQIEAAVYFCVLEALQNVAKYAQAPAARVTLRPDGQCLAFTVEDDGTGFDPATTPRGTGLQGISDRLGALGGSAEVTSAPGRGTRVTGRVPGTEPA